MTNHLFDGLFSNTNPKSSFASLNDGRHYTYQDVLDISTRFANTLGKIGVKKGDRVAVQIPKSVEAVLLYIACVRVGAIFLPLNTAYTASEVDYFLSDATPFLFVCDPSTAEEMQPVAEKYGAVFKTLGQPTIEDPEAGTFLSMAKNAALEFQNVPCLPDDLAAILYTSGTTGRSKGAMLSHNNLLSNSMTLKDLWHFGSSDVLLHALPIFHTHGLFVAINITLVAGSSMVFLSGFNADDVIENLPRATALMGVPTFYTRLLDDERFTKSQVDHMRLFISGSAPLLAETHIQFEQLTGKRILERYGMTETNMNTSNPYNGERRAGTVGFPLPGVDVRVANPDTGESLSRGEIGVLEVAGANVFSGYWKMPEKTAEEFRDDGFFITGDLAQIDADGYIHIVGRSKDLIISGGYNIYPKEIELLLDEEKGIKESAVIGVPHRDFGETVLAIVVADKSTMLDVDHVLDNLRAKLARFKHPRGLKILDELPRNTMGKVQKNVLRDQFGEEFMN